MTRSRTAAAIALAAGALVLFAGCAGNDDVRTEDSAKDKKNEAQAPPSDEPVDPVPTLKPPKGPPSGPTDAVKGKRVTLTGVVVQKPGGCTMLDTPDRGTVVLVDGRPGTFGLGNGHKVEVVAVIRTGLRTGCGDDLPTYLVEQAKPI